MTTHSKVSSWSALALVGLCLTGAVDALEQPEKTGERPTFSKPLEIDNHWFPFPKLGQVGTKTILESDGAIEIATFVAETKLVQWGGTTVECRVLIEDEYHDDVLVETSVNYFAQGDDGSVYYFGEVTESTDPAADSIHEGSWVVGKGTVDKTSENLAVADDPMLFMPSSPDFQSRWSPEYLTGVVEEHARVLRSNLRINIPGGVFEGCIAVHLYDGISNTIEVKLYAPGVGYIAGLDREDSDQVIFVSPEFQ